MSRPLERTRRRSADRGSASLWVVAGLSFVVVVALVVVLRTQALLARHRAESGADLTALAAAAQIGVSGDQCGAAGRVAVANGVTLAWCHVVTDDEGLSGIVETRVTVTVELPGWGRATVSASARAGRDPPDDPAGSARRATGDR